MDLVRPRRGDLMQLIDRFLEFLSSRIELLGEWFWLLREGDDCVWCGLRGGARS